MKLALIGDSITKQQLEAAKTRCKAIATNTFGAWVWELIGKPILLDNSVNSLWNWSYRPLALDVLALGEPNAGELPFASQMKTSLM